MHRVVITGMGAVCPIGLTVREAWQALMDGRSGAGEITLFDSSAFDVHIAAEVKNFERTPRTNGLAYMWQFGIYGGPNTHALWNRAKEAERR